MGKPSRIYRPTTYPEGKVNVAAFDPTTRAHGPGERFAIWTQGCAINCVGCGNPHMLEAREQDLMTPEQLIFLIGQAVTCVRPIEGITLMGGEPMEQAQALAPIIEQVRAQHGLNVLTFTGFTLKKLRALQNEWVNRLLKATDTLIAGPFVQRKLDPSSIVGSTNQRVHHLTDALNGRDFARKHAEFSVQAEASGVAVHQSGFLPHQLIQQ